MCVCVCKFLCTWTYIYDIYVKIFTYNYTNRNLHTINFKSDHFNVEIPVFCVASVMICYSTEGFLPLPVSTSPPALVGAKGVSFRKRGCLMARQGLFWHQQNRGRHSGANNTNSNFQQVPQNLFMESKVSKSPEWKQGALHCLSK